METVSSVGTHGTYLDQVIRRSERAGRPHHDMARRPARPILRGPEPRHILVVDDNPATRHFVREALSLEGYDVTEASGGQSALEACATRVPDLILIDLCLSDMCGTEVVRRLRSHARTAEIPVVVFTGAPEEVDDDHDFSDVLTKPVDAESLIEAVRSHLTAQPAPRPQTGRRARVLLVDAQPARSIRVRLHLRRLGFEVMVAATASQALRSARAFRPDLIVADLVLPDTTSLELTRVLRTSDQFVDVPVVLTSSAPWSQVQQHLAERAGATAFVTLTPDLGSLRDAVVEALDDPTTPAPVPVEGDHEEHLLRELHDQYRRQIDGSKTRQRGQAELAVLQGLAEALSDTADLDVVLREALARCLHAIGASRGAIYVEEIDGGFSLRAHLGDPAHLPGAHLPAEHDLFHRVTTTGETIIVDSRSGEVAEPDAAGARAHPSTILAPLTAGTETFGVLIVEVPSHEDLAYWVQFLKLVGLALGFAVASARHAPVGRPVAAVGPAHDPARDPLTGLASAGGIEADLAEVLEDSTSEGVLLVVDVDRIRHVNDALGHHTGDELLKGVARALESAAGAGATVARLHGDVFAILSETSQGVDGAVLMARRVMAALESPVRCNGYTLYTTASIGISLFPDHARRPAALIQHATTALDQAKERGGNTFEVYSERRANSLWQRLTVDQGLRAALEREQFVLHYQPIVDLATGDVVEAEALLRWDRPLHGLTAAATFIDVAEETGLIVPIGRWVVANAAAQAAAWQAEGRPIRRVAVNVGAREFQQGHVYDTVLRVLEEGVDPRLLTLEITERVALVDVDHAVRTLRRLRALGIHASLDDFGTGYSSLRYVQELPIDTLKIDRSFVANAASDPKGEPILASIIDLAHKLGMTVVAEGIETEACLELVRSLGCDMAQGYFLGRPGPAEDLGALLPQCPEV